MFYENTLYPLQDKIFKIINNLNTSFYLSGGTALSRFYFNHRYSDDLDFFVNADPEFNGKIKFVLKALTEHGIKYAVEIKDDDFYRIAAEEILKIDFVNDIPSYYGTVEKRPSGPFVKIDNLLNILANKITAFNDREEPKDVADIWIISKKMSINWKDIFTSVNSKAAGINPPSIAKKIEEFNLEQMKKIKWIKEPADEKIKFDLEQTVNKILAL